MTAFRARVVNWSVAEKHPPTLLIDVETATPAIKASVDQIILRDNGLHIRIGTRDINPGGISAQVLTSARLSAPIPDGVIERGQMAHIFIDGTLEKIAALT